MKVIIFIGSVESGANSTASIISNYLLKRLKEKNIETTVFNLSQEAIPMLDFSFPETPQTVKNMTEQFLAADTHFWLAPLYHGSIPGAMKNCLDWLETTSRLPKPYLTDKKVATICWADGVQAMNGINAMENISKALRAWSLPYSVPVARKELMDTEKEGAISGFYTEKLDRLIETAVSRKIFVKEV
ncbi:arsenical resistance protein ArsH [Salegentibacter echinorum]|uniref:Arsenical resistance protein ArsH n=1 Tax=Salegentibacter echinorum TaxID=1073325 RepID=A0A1M5JSS5_SALEC|nr:NADPH-dependent FMN reductase [Salegentibacter echinorum]SHG43329.1 arsenical resistance protein ArsH [Salegentibacter echinorum]